MYRHSVVLNDSGQRGSNLTRHCNCTITGHALIWDWIWWSEVKFLIWQKQQVTICLSTYQLHSNKIKTLFPKKKKQKQKKQQHSTLSRQYTISSLLPPDLICWLRSSLYNTLKFDYDHVFRWCVLKLITKDGCSCSVFKHLQDIFCI